MSSQHTIVEAKNPHRLPRTVVPSFYDIKVSPDLQAATFTGEEKILLEIHEPVDALMLNSAGLSICDVVLQDDTGTRMEGSVSIDEENERAILKFKGSIGAGHWELLLKFAGSLDNKQLKGFYRSTYKDGSGNEQAIATTKFEPCDARRAFPCWDEPDFKARFKIALVIDRDLTAVSNARLLKETDVEGNKKQLEFAPSIVMSTYLVAYVIGKLEASEPVVADGKEIRVWCVPGKQQLSPFALSAAKFSLEYFARYFQQPYPGDKLDLIAIPDFASGAMENFGCITFRETALLVDQSTASHAELERVAEVVMHENAHMWFGDFVTMTWWNGLWLNEAFATFMAAKAMDAWRPEWKFWEGFNVQRAAAMRIDGLHSTRSIEFPVGLPNEARAMFDVLTYEKGCAVLRMLELFIGEENFRRGIIEYLEKHRFANADTPDLWAAIEPFAPQFSEHVTVSDLMNTWVFQPGYPVVSVEESRVSGSITLSQKQFRYKNGTTAGNTTWHIPVHVVAKLASGEEVTKSICLSKEAETFYIGENLASVIVNAGGNGFFRVSYSQSLQDHLMNQFHALSPGERFNFVSDLWAMVLSGQKPLKDYLRVASALTDNGETDVNVLSVVLGSLSYLRRIVSHDSKHQAGLLNLARRILSPVLKNIGDQPQAGDSPQQAQLRGSILAILGTLGDQQVCQRAKDMFAAHVSKKELIDGNLIGAVVDTVASHGGAPDYERFIELKTIAATPQEEQRYLFALASFRDEQLIGRTLASTISGSIRTQDAPYVVRNLLMNPWAGRQAWNFLKTNWSTMATQYPASGLSRMCEGITALVDAQLEQEARSFFAEHVVKGGEKAIAQYLELLQIAVLFAQRERSELEALLTADSK